MRNVVILLIVGAVMGRTCLAEEPPATTAPEAHTPIPVYTEPAAVYFGGTEPHLNLQEAAGVGITRQWQEKSYSAMAQQPGPDGAVQFRYGECLPTIVCAVLNITDVELQPGEAIIDHGLQLGDNRWTIDTAKNPNDPDSPQHIYLKPCDIGLSTSLVVTTDRRTYCFRLLSTAERYMHRVTFVYPNAAPVASSKPQAAPDPKPAPQKVKVALEDPAPAPRRSRPTEREGKGEVNTSSREDDGYRISGRAPWRPQRVYNNGKQTFIELPEDVSSKEAPALFVLRKGGFLGLGQQKSICNYRLHGSWIVADAVIDRAELVTGVGRSKDRVTIRREKKGEPDEN